MNVKKKTYLYLLILCFAVLGVPANGLCVDYCFEEAAEQYNVPAELLWSISRGESSHNPEAYHVNKNGSYDFCHMQINSSWYKALGPDVWDSIANPCQCTKVGAWVLAQCVARHGYNWNAIGCYNAGSKPKNVNVRAKYAWKVHNTLEKAKKSNL